MQGSYGSWETWRVMKFKNFIFQDWKRLWTLQYKSKVEKLLFSRKWENVFFPFGLFYVIEIYDNVFKTKDNKI